MRILSKMLAAVALGATLVSAQAAPRVTDRTGENVTEVARVLQPASVDEIRAALRAHRGTVSVGGARYSMGGQAFAPGSLHLDMSRMNRILAIDAQQKTLRVEAGATWHEVQRALDPHHFAVKVMQSYANFSVGGSISVNAHGRYVREGPIGNTVRSLSLVLASGELVEASRTRRPDLFFAAIGGYGGVGVIVAATLELADNEPLARSVERMALSDYRAYFEQKVRGDARAVMHNGDLYPPHYDQVLATTFSRSERPPTESARLRPERQGGWLARGVAWALSELPFGHWLRREIFDPWRLRGEQVVWRNFEASYDVSRLGGRVTRGQSFVLQEYFLPPKMLESFVGRFREILQRHGVKMLNVAIRHAEADEGSLLAWAPQARFALVLYYAQEQSAAALAREKLWTRELIDAALELGGSFYLPYHLLASPAQFRRAYPRQGEFFAVKKRADPRGQMQNRLWELYLPSR